MGSADTRGIVTLASPHAFAETLRRIRAALADHGATVFATIDHQAAAKEAGLTMPPATVIVFGNPRVGTPLMLARPSVALDLPSKVLVAEDAHGRVVVRFNTAAWLVGRHDLPPESTARLAPLGQLVRNAVTG